MLQCSAAPAFGAKKFKEVGVIAQRATLVLSLVSILIAASWVFADPFFSVLHQDKHVTNPSFWSLLPNVWALGVQPGEDIHAAATAQHSVPGVANCAHLCDVRHGSC